MTACSGYSDLLDSCAADQILGIEFMTLDRRAALIVLTGLAMGLAGITDARADGDSKPVNKDRDIDDHYDATKARAAGEILPVSEILAEVKKNYPGEVVGFELEQEDGRWIYEFKIITPENHFIEVYIDAKNKNLIEVEGK